MISRISVAALLVATMFTTACAEEPTAPETIVQTSAPAAAAQSATFTAPDTAWRDLDQDNLLYIDTKYGKIVVEMAPEFAPKHVAQIKTLTSQKFYDYVTFHRVIDGFMNQTGDPGGDGTGDSDLPDIPAEFTFRRDPGMKVTLLDKRPASARNPQGGIVDVGYYKSFPVATQPAMQAALTKDGKVEAWGLHCPGSTSMARSSNPNSANSQFFLMRNKLPEDLNPISHLDRDYTVWGNTVWGIEHIDKFKVGTKGEVETWVPDQMETVRLGSELPEVEQLKIQVLKTSGPDFKRFLTTQKTAEGRYNDICKITIPSRLKP